MKLTVLYFASLREKLGIDREEIDVPASGATAVITLGEVRTWLRGRDGEWDAALSDGRLRMALNQRLADAATPVAEGNELAFFPPVTGG